MILVVLLITVIIIIYYRLSNKHNYWPAKGVAQKDVVPILGHSKPLLFKTKAKVDMMRDIYRQFPDKRYLGFYQFTSPVLLIRDPDLIKQIAIKDFDHFVDHKIIVPVESDPLWGKNLFNLKGDKWKQMRGTLSPSFTSSKMKAMFHLMSECSENFTKYFLNHSEDAKNVSMKDVLTRYTNDMIATTAFGVKCDSLENQENEFYLMGKDATNFSGFFKTLSLIIAFLQPNLGKFLNIKVFNTNVATFFRKIISETIKEREEKHILRHDMLHLLMEARKGKLKSEENANAQDTGFATVQEHITTDGNGKADLTDEDITAQALIFFVGGFDTVSQLMHFMSYELAINPDVQKKLQDEIDDVNESCNGKLTYDALIQMKYMDMVVTESLRKWPSLVTVDRICVKPYTIQPINSDEKPVHLKKDELIWFPIDAIHRDPQYYPDPDRFDPERFSDKNKSKIKPYTYLPFGVGPRNCIGSRFALLETKILFYHILSKFDLVPNENTQIPLELKKGTITTIPKKPIVLTMKPRE